MKYGKYNNFRMLSKIIKETIVKIPFTWFLYIIKRNKNIKFLNTLTKHIMRVIKNHDVDRNSIKTYPFL